MSQDKVIDLVSSGLYTIVMVAAPPLILGLSVGLIVSIFQAVTSIQEQTLAFIPKILAVLLSLLLFGPFMLSMLTQYYNQLITELPYIINQR